MNSLGSNKTPGIGIFGGSFDPPHFGHLILAQAAQEQLGLEQVLWVVAGQSPFKQAHKLSQPALRVAMVAAAIAGNPRFSLSLVDVERPAPHYTIDTVQLIATQYPERRLFFLLGADSLRDFATWRQPAQILELCELAVLKRPQVTPDVSALIAQLPSLATRLHWLDAPQIDIAARKLRQRVADGQSLRYFTPAPVQAFITAQQLYRTADE